MNGLSGVADTRPPRALVLHSGFLGFRTLREQWQRTLVSGDDLHVTHQTLPSPLWLRAAGASIGRRLGINLWGWDFVPWRLQHAARPAVAARLGGEWSNAYDVALVVTQGVALAFAAARERGKGLPFLPYVDSTMALEVRIFGHAAIPARATIAHERRIFRAASSIVCMSEWAAASVRDDYGLSPERVAVVPGGVEIPDVDAPVPRRRDQGVRLAFVGNDWRRKGGDVLLEVHQRYFADVAELHVWSSDVPATVAGRGGLRNVFLHGTVDRATLLADLSGMDLLVLPTRVDMSPWVILEAAAAGVAAVATRIGAIGELLLDGETGLLIEPDPPGMSAARLRDTLQGLLTRPERLRAMGDAAREHVRRHHDPTRLAGRLRDRLIRVARDSRPIT